MSSIDFSSYNHQTLGKILTTHKNRSSLADVDLVHARKMAQKTGLWQVLDKKLQHKPEIPLIPYSTFRQFKWNGNRTQHQDTIDKRHGAYRMNALAACLNHPQKDIAYLQDLIWAICDEHTWVMPAHEICHIDLGSIALMVHLAEMMQVIGDQLEPEIIARVRAQLHERGLGLYQKSSTTDSWHTTHNNWNLVCNGGLIRLALLELEDPKEQAQIIYQSIHNMTYALEGFTDDGGCDEGKGYWGYGVGEFALAALALSAKTKGKINLMQAQKIKNICSYPLAVHIEKHAFAPYSDTAQGSLNHLPALIINHFHELPALFKLCERNKQGLFTFNPINSNLHHTLSLYPGKPIIGDCETGDSYLPDLRFAKCRSISGPQQTTVIALAANNGLSHNHNDTGHVCIFRHGQFYLDDLGAPVYSKATFSDKRYDSLFCNAYGHSLPIINGQEQLAGKKYTAKMRCKNFHSDNDKTITMDLEKSFPKACVQKFQRSIYLGHKSHHVTWHDQFSFDKKPKSLIENFITYLPVQISADKKSARIGSGKKSLCVNCEQAGTFSAIVCTAESKEGRSDKVATRILFHPQVLNKEMSLTFTFL